MCTYQLIMKHLNRYVLQCISCASERKFFRIYSALQIKLLLLLYIPYCHRWVKTQPSVRTGAPGIVRGSNRPSWVVHNVPTINTQSVCKAWRYAHIPAAGYQPICAANITLSLYDPRNKRFAWYMFVYSVSMC